MMIVALIAGIGLLLAGLVTVGFGIELDLSFGNTLILAGAVTACTGTVLVGIWMLLRELKNIARRLGPEIALQALAETAPRPVASSTALGDQSPEEGGLLLSHDQPMAQNGGHAEPAAPPPWLGETVARDRPRGESQPAPEVAETAPASKPRRNLLFSSTSRKERERAQVRTSESPEDLRPAPAAAPPGSDAGEAPPATFDDAWPKSERGRAADAPPPRRASRAPSTFADAGAGAAGANRPVPPLRNETAPPVTVLKSGVVDGMAYSLYSDGSIEAQMPEGMMRFASIDELRAHLDQRP
jgi:hypothetical protein